MAMDTEGIVLKSFNYGDNHKIIRVLTNRYGLIGIFINNANKPRSRNGSLAQPLILASFTLKESSGEGDLHFLYNGEVENSFYQLKLDYEKVAYFYQMAEIILKGDIEHEAGPYLFSLLKKILLLAEEGVSMVMLNIAFLLKMLPLLGIRPSLDCCASCGTVQHIAAASVSQGGIICSNCYGGKERVVILAKQIPLLRAMERVKLERLRDVELEESDLEALELFLEGWYESYSGLHLKSSKILKVLR